eukprot:1159255-Pelagomonas_calceolata.AAC.7
MKRARRAVEDWETAKLATSLMRRNYVSLTLPSLISGAVNSVGAAVAEAKLVLKLESCICVHKSSTGVHAKSYGDASGAASEILTLGP